METSNKILTIAICAYNMEKYICNCLDSCLINSIEDIEVLVLNDGSTDRTAEIVKEYQNKYPESIFLINKPNGGWGSNLNMAVTIATGKYFKNLDADDWYERDNLQKLVEFMKTTEVDFIATKYRVCYPEKKVDDAPKWGKYGGKEVILNDIKEGLVFPIWDISYKTEMVKKYYTDLPHGSLYTDNLYVYEMMQHVKTAYFMDILIYNYRLGRDGQSMSSESMHKHYKEMLTIIDTMLIRYKEGLPENNSQHVIRRLTCTYSGFMRSLIRLQGYEDVNGVEILKEYDSRLKEEYKEIYDKTNEFKFLRAARMLNYKCTKILVKFAR